MSEGSGIRVLIVDDHAVVRSGLSLIVGSEEDLEVVGEAGNAREAIFEARSLKPDVILLDVVMPDQSGLDVLHSSTSSRKRGCSCSRCRTTPST